MAALTPRAGCLRMAALCKKAFGWKTQMLGQEMGDYVLVTTAESDAKPGAPAGAINGGFFPKKPDWPAQRPWSSSRWTTSSLPCGGSCLNRFQRALEVIANLEPHLDGMAPDRALAVLRKVTTAAGVALER